MVAERAGDRKFWYNQIYFINIFYAFVLDNNFCFFEHANELIHMLTHLTSFIEFKMILNKLRGSYLQLGYFVLNVYWKSWRNSLKNTYGRVIILNKQRCRM